MELPKQWCVQRTPQNYKEINKYFSLMYGKQYKGKGSYIPDRPDYMHFPRVITRKYTQGRASLTFPKHVVISFETFIKYVLKEEKKNVTLSPENNIEMKKDTTSLKLIGYKLKFPEYRKAALAICNTNGNWENSLQNYDISVDQNGYIGRLTNAEVLDKWFEEVYETAPVLPTIRGGDNLPYDGYVNDGYVIYGCAYLPIMWFTSSPNRVINAMNVGDNVFITTEQMTAIRNYLKYYGHVK